jgi:ribosomal protein S18 acetylase RimI-like enzyme
MPKAEPTPRYHFRDIRRDDFARVTKWLAEPHGSAIIRQRSAELFARGARRIVIDPDPANVQAIRAYEKAGFRYIETRPSIYGPAHFMAPDAPEETDLI